MIELDWGQYARVPGVLCDGSLPPKKKTKYQGEPGPKAKKTEGGDKAAGGFSESTPPLEEKNTRYLMIILHTGTNTSTHLCTHKHVHTHTQTNTHTSTHTNTNTKTRT